MPEDHPGRHQRVNVQESLVVFRVIVQRRAFVEAHLSEVQSLGAVDLLQSAILLYYLLKAAELMILRKEIGIEHIGAIMCAEVDHEIAPEILAESLDAFRHIPIQQFGDHGYE